MKTLILILPLLLVGCSTLDVKRSHYDAAGNLTRVDEITIRRSWGTSDNSYTVNPNTGETEARASGEGMSTNFRLFGENVLPAVAESATRGAVSGALGRPPSAPTTVPNAEGEN